MSGINYANTAVELAREAERRKQEIEEMRNIPEDMMQRVKAVGLVRMWAANRFNGGQLKVSEVVKILESMAYYNGSIAWVVGVTNCSSLYSGYFPAKLAQSLFANKMSMVGGFAGPAGVAVIVPGGLKVTGQWSWGSGIRHCTHIVAGVKLVKDNKFAGTGLVFFHPKEVHLEDNWQVLGLKGTHSINYSAQDVFIPDGRWSVFPLSTSVIEDPLYRFSPLGALSLSIAAVGLGLAKRAVQEVVELAKIKQPFGQGKPLAQRAIPQQQTGELHGNYLAASSLLYQTIAKGETEALKGKCSAETKGAIRLAACHATTLSLATVRYAYQLAGGSAIWAESKIQELFRDMQVLAQHGMVNSGNYRTAGSVFLGNEVPESAL